MLNELVLKYMSIAKQLEKENQRLIKEVEQLEEVNMELLDRIDQKDEEIEGLEDTLEELGLLVDQLEYELDKHDDTKKAHLEYLEKRTMELWQKMKEEGRY